MNAPQPDGRRSARIRPLLFVCGGCLVLGIVATMPLTAARLAPEDQKTAASAPVGDPGDAGELYQRMHTLAHQSMEIIDRSFEMGAPVENAVDRLISLSWELLTTDMYASQDPDQPRSSAPEAYFAHARGAPNPLRVRAFEEHVRRLRDWEHRFRKLYERNFLSRLDYNNIQLARLGAEALLARELHKPQ